jgi:uncharacterized protein (TIGR02271 family)
MSQSDTAEVSIPLVQEHVKVNKRTVETGRVRIRSVVDEKLVRVAEDLEREDVIIERVPVNREVTEPPAPREENGVLIVPILEEVMVVEKRLMLKEELYVRRNRKREHVAEAVRLKSMHAEVERIVPSGPGRREAERASGARVRRKERLVTPRK